MKFFLDVNERFLLTSKDHGWELTVDEKIVHYCQRPVDALTYMSETLMEIADAQGVESVITAVAMVKRTIDRAAEVVVAMQSSRLVAPIIASMSNVAPDRRECIRVASLKLAGCTEPEFRAREDARDIVMMAKAILEPWFELHGIE